MRRGQSGMSYSGFMLLVGILGAIVKVGAVVAPIYYDNYTIDKIIVSLFRDGRGNTIEDFKRGFSDRLQINNIRDKTPDDFQYEFKDRKLTVVMDYEVRKPFIANLDVVVSFKKNYGRELKAEIE